MFLINIAGSSHKVRVVSGTWVTTSQLPNRIRSVRIVASATVSHLSTCQ